MEYKVYWSGIEYNYGKSSIDRQKLKGGFVYAFIKASDVTEAMDKLLDSLKKQHLIPVEIEFMSPYDKEMEWETLKQAEHYSELYEEALSSLDVVFDDFYAYENE